MKSRLLMSTCAMSIACATAPRPQSSIVQQGATVRFHTTRDDAPRSGRLAKLTPDSLVLATCGNCDRLLYSRSEIRSLEVMRSVPSSEHISNGVLLGAAIGAGLGAIAAKTCHGTADVCEMSGLAIPLLAGAGALIGAFAGWLRSYTWEPVPAGQ